MRKTDAENILLFGMITGTDWITIKTWRNLKVMESVRTGVAGVEDRCKVAYAQGLGVNQLSLVVITLLSCASHVY
jgi:hypothetical protein